MERDRAMWSAICHSCMWTVTHRERKAVHAAGVEHRITSPEHLVAVEWQESAPSG
jgi:hypothetical protein